MSSLVRQYLAVQLLLERHRGHDLEYTAAAIFQSTFAALFPITEAYAVNCEQSVDQGRPRIDLFVQGSDAVRRALFPICVGEGKGGGASAKEVEDQVLKRCKEAIQFYGVDGIYAFTFLKESFRVWRVEGPDLTLDPMDGMGPRNERKSYIFLDSKQGECIVRLTNIMKFGEGPEDHYPPTGSTASYAMSTRSAAGIPVPTRSGFGQGMFGPGASGSGGPSVQPPPGEDDDDPMLDVIQDKGKRAVKWREVEVVKEGHTLRPSEYIFADVKGKMRVTHKKDWEKDDSQANTIWVCQGSRMTYYTHQDINKL